MQTWSIQGNTCGLPTFCGETGNNRNTAGKCSQYRELGEQVRLGFMELEGMVQRMLLFSCSVVSQLLSNPWTAACQASLTSTISQSLLKLMSIESVMFKERQRLQTACRSERVRAPVPGNSGCTGLAERQQATWTGFVH